MNAAAQREDIPEEVFGNGTDGLPLSTPAAPSTIRTLAAERLAAHRSRRNAASQILPPDLQARREALQHEAHPATSRVRDAVAARYRQSLSYREFLAAEARRALEKAEAEAEVATRNAVAVAVAQRRLLEEIEQWNQPEPPPSQESQPTVVASPVLVQPQEQTAAPRPAHSEKTLLPVAASLKVQLYESVPQVFSKSVPQVFSQSAHAESLAERAGRYASPEEVAELDQEIAFRLSPEFPEFSPAHRIETQPIQANIIEFPRQLVASRKARPRLAEGPLREDGTPEPQLRIFEVEPEQISVEPESVSVTAAPEWQSLLLSSAATPHFGHALETYAYTRTGQHLDHTPDAELTPYTAPALHPAPVARRLAATSIDGACVVAGLAIFGATAARMCHFSLHTLPAPAALPMLGGAAAVTLVCFALLYQLLFFTLNEATPGMRCTRVGLCTFTDENPTRRAMRRRLFATALAVTPAGLGVMWTLLDSDRLGWHDRISRMYLRRY